MIDFSDDLRKSLWFAFKSFLHNFIYSNIKRPNFHRNKHHSTLRHLQSLHHSTLPYSDFSESLSTATSPIHIHERCAIYLCFFPFPNWLPSNWHGHCFMNSESSSSQVRPLCLRGFTCKWLRHEEGKLGDERENALSPPEVCSKENKINFTITFRQNVLIYLTDESLTSLDHFNWRRFSKVAEMYVRSVFLCFRLVCYV